MVDIAGVDIVFRQLIFLALREGESKDLVAKAVGKAISSIARGHCDRIGVKSHRIQSIGVDLMEDEV